MFNTPTADNSGVSSLMSQGGLAQPTAPQQPAGPSPASRMWGWLNQAMPVANAQTNPNSAVGLGGAIDPNISANIAAAAQNVGAPNAGTPVTPPVNPGAGDFSSAFAGMTPEQQAAYSAANPNVNTTTGFPVSSNPQPQSYSINPGPTINSSSMNPTLSTADALAAAARARAGLMGGTGPQNHVPSDGLYQNVINGIFNASQYSPQELSALDQFNQTQGKIIQTQLAARRQIKDLQESGQITKAEGSAFLTEAQRRSDAQLADLAASQAGNTLSLQTLGLMRQNQLGAFQNIAGMLKPTEVAPGSTLVNPVTGQPTYQGNGASPATVMQTAQQLATMAIQSGTMQYNPDGTPNLQPYLEQAQSYYQTHNMVGGGQAGTGTPGAAPQGGGLPPQLQTYLTASGGAIINEDKVPANQQAIIQQLAAQNGVPYLKSGDLDKYQSILVTQENLKNMQVVSDRILSSGLGGRTVGALWNQISGALQLNPDVASFKAWRDTAVNTIQALAGGQGSGFRLNQAEINLAANNLPTITDNLETAKAKMTIVNDMLGRWQNQILRGNPNAGAPGSGGSNVIQTKVGAVDNSWFQ